jgi:hypothetical protein
MEGQVALELAALYHELPAAIMLIDSVILPPPAFVDSLRPVGEALHGPCYRQALEQAVATLFLPTRDAARQRRLLARMSLPPQHVAASAFVNHLIEHDASAAAAGCAVPAAYIRWTAFNLSALTASQLNRARSASASRVRPLARR